VIVGTSQGRVEGREEGGAWSFRGIPYAASTAAAARFRPPIPPEPWAGVRAATRSGPISPQKPGLMSRILGDGGARPGEDCLSLNVFTPVGAGARRPVLVWIHGGGFNTGAGSLPVYDAAALAWRGDLVVVTLNYRLGALGFLYLPELAAEAGGAPGNFGLLDQIAALEWVRENVAAFGGDPERVTLAGQSAGAMCIGTLIGLPAGSAARGLFARAILQSGAGRNVHSAEQAARVASAFLEEAGVRRGPGSPAALRALPVEAVLAAQERTSLRLRRELDDPAFQPVLDGALLPATPPAVPPEASAEGLPLLIGTNRDEWRFYGLGDPKAALLDEAGLLRRFRRGLPGRDSQGGELAARVIETYRAARRGRAGVSPTELWFAIQTDRWFRHPAMQLAEAQAARGGETYAYLFEWASPAFGGTLGSCHALDVPFVFGGVDTPRLQPLLGQGEAVRALSEQIQAAWCGFVRGEVPAHPELPDWPRYDAGRRATLVLGAQSRVVDAPQERERAFWDRL